MCITFSFLTLSYILAMRILIKLSWETFKWNSEDNFDYAYIGTLAKKLKKLHEKGLEIVLVVGGGNIFRGTQHTKGKINEAIGHYMWMLAGVMNGLALSELLKAEDLKVKTFSSFDVPRFVDTLSRYKVIEYIDKWYIIIAAGGSGNPYYTHDSAGVLRALELDCDLMVKATKVDWVYDKDPKKYPDAKKFDTLSLKDAFKQELKVMDHAAIATAMDNKLPILVCNTDDIEHLGSDKVFGTKITTD